MSNYLQSIIEKSQQELPPVVDLDEGQRVEEVAEELQESDLEEEPVGWQCQQGTQ